MELEGLLPLPAEGHCQSRELYLVGTSELGHEVIVVHARNVRLIGEPAQRRSSGRADVGTADGARREFFPASPRAALVLLPSGAIITQGAGRETR